MAETPDKETQGDKQPEAAQQVASSRVPAIAVSLAALVVIGAATANSLPNFDRLSLPDFRRSFLHAGLQPLLLAGIQSGRCAASKDGSSPDNRSRRQGGTEGYSVVAAAKRSSVGVAHAELRSSTGRFEKNIPSTLLADGAGEPRSELSAESSGAVDDFQHPAFKSSRSGRPGVAKSNSSTAQAVALFR